MSRTIQIQKTCRSAKKQKHRQHYRTSIEHKIQNISDSGTDQNTGQQIRGHTYSDSGCRGIFRRIFFCRQNRLSDFFDFIPQSEQIFRNIVASQKIYSSKVTDLLIGQHIIQLFFQFVIIGNTADYFITLSRANQK